MTLDDEGGPQQLGLGVLFGFVRNQGDGWTQALNYLTRYLDDALIATDGRSPELPDPDLFFLALARQIGIRTGQMHRALAEQAGNDPDFMPEPITSEDIAEWCSALEINAAEMLSELDRERGRLSQRALEQADQLLAAREMLFSAICTLLPSEIDAQKSRIHGDYHLGQVIVVQDDHYILNFAGDQTRPLAQRRAKSSPLRDVAGMIRSFDYAAIAAVRQLAETRVAAEPRMTELAEAWRQRAVDGFRAAYRKAMRGCATYPASKRRARDMLIFFMLERAVQEVRTDLAQRPQWVDIPLRGLLGSAEQIWSGGWWLGQLIRGTENGRAPSRRPNQAAQSPKRRHCRRRKSSPRTCPRRPHPHLPIRKSRQSSRRVTATLSHFSACTKTPAAFAVRAMLPQAQQVAVIDSSTGNVAAEGERVHPDGLIYREHPRPEASRFATGCGSRTV